MGDMVPVRYMTAEWVMNVAGHIERVLDESKAEELGERARVFLLEEFPHMPEEWREVLSTGEVNDVSVAIALGMCTHESNDEFEEEHSDPREQ
jgi:hypothetical protein